jgi:hypothetical protein
MGTTSKIIRPEPNKPITGVVIESRAVESKFGGEQVLVTLEGGRLLYLPPAAARTISAGHAYTIIKKQIAEGLRATWDVKPAEPEPAPVRGRVNDPRLHVEPAYDDGPYTTETPFNQLEQKLGESIQQVKERKLREYQAAKAADAANTANRTVRDPGGRTIDFPQSAPAPSRLTAALCAAVDAAAAATKHAKEKHGIDVVFDAEMIKCLGVTAYIQNARSTQ